MKHLKYIAFAILQLAVGCSRPESQAQAGGGPRSQPTNSSSIPALFPYTGPLRTEPLLIPSLLEPIKRALIAQDVFAEPVNGFLPPEQILRQIHPWLTEGLGLGPVEQVGSFQIRRLRAIPHKVLQQILALGERNGAHTGFLVLQQSFWDFVTDSDVNRGVQTAFLVSNWDPESRQTKPVSGVYFPSLRLIAYNVSANEGTQAHEFEHHQQYTRMEATPRSRSRAPRLLNEECISHASKELGEVGATSVQLAYWPSVVQDLKILPELDELQIAALNGESIGRWSIHSPTAHLHLNLKYPVDAMLNLSRLEACPEELRQAALEIARNLAPIVEETYTMHREVQNLRLRYLRSLASGEMDNAAQQAFELEADQLLSRIRALINAEPIRRNTFIQQKLEALTPALRRELCGNVRGVERFLNCAR